MKHSEIQASCPMDALLRIISGPWTSYIIWILTNHGSVRFGELKRLVPGISSRLLTDRLRKLEEAGLVTRDYKPTIPPEVSYSLTDRGLQLRSVMVTLSELAFEWDLAVGCEEGCGPD